MSPTRKISRPRQEILKIEKKIFRQNQKAITAAADVTDKDYKNYLARYRKATKTFKRASKVSDVLKDMAKSRIVLIGDYHTLDQSQRSFVRSLRHYFRAQDQNVIVALETVQHNHQKHLDAFMQSQIDAKTFIKKIGFKQSWFFDLWRNYEVIFDYLKYHKISTYGIEAHNHHKKTLLERDEFMAQNIVNIAAHNPGKVIFVLVGDLHLAPQHLPRQIQKHAKKQGLKLPLLTLHQNSPEIYWQLSEKEVVDHTMIVKMDDKAYCRMHTPPIIVQQSYINWLYHEEEGHFDWIDAKSSFVAIVERLAKVLALDLPKDYEDIDVYTCGDLGFMDVLKRKKVFSKKDLQFIHDQILNSESYFMPQARIAYIANVSIHHAAEEASHYLKFLLSGLEFPRSHKDAFYANVLHEAIGFFGSKIINSKRKSPGLKDFTNQIKYLEQAGLAVKRHVEYETCHLFIKCAQLTKKGQLLHSNKIVNLTSQLFLSLSHALGYDLGDCLYYGYMEGVIDKEYVQELFTNPFQDEGETGEEYLNLVKHLRRVKRPVHL